ncbi:hypothetical protein VTK56DRAFT_8994 [Thermocarpiscus australiensis]
MDETDAESVGSDGSPSSDGGPFIRLYSGQLPRTSNAKPAIWTRLPHASTVGQINLLGHDRRANRSSATWSSSSGDLTGLSDTDDIQVRDEFVQEYNRLARKHGIGTLEPEKHSPTTPPGGSPLHQRKGWFSRAFLRQPSTSSKGSSTSSDRASHKRSVSDLATHFMNGTRRDSLKDEDLQSLVRLCGKSLLYLPSEYAPGSLVLPTCFRATAQYLIQHGVHTRGIFRIPGSVRVVNALYDYYCADGDVDEIDSTICCPNIPAHIGAGTHDVASTFKRLLSGLPGGILGSLSLFDALVAIHSQLKGDAECTRTKQTKLMARLIALAIGTVRSRFRRELICAVFGLLCLIGRTAEKAPREDEHGRPLPTADLMGYNALGIVFGPLLIGELINSYTMKLANPNSSGLHSVPSPKARKERRKWKVPEEAHQPALSVDKIRVANTIAEMVITHWREVVRHMKSLGVLKTGRDGSEALAHQPWLKAVVRPSATEAFMRRPTERSRNQFSPMSLNIERSSITPDPPPNALGFSTGRPGPDTFIPSVAPRGRPRTGRLLSSSRFGVKASVPLLSPTVEEPSHADLDSPKGPHVIENERNSPHPAMHCTATITETPSLGRAPPCSSGQELVSSLGAALWSPWKDNRETAIQFASRGRHFQRGSSSSGPPRTPNHSTAFLDQVPTPDTRKGRVIQPVTGVRNISPPRSAAAEPRSVSSPESFTRCQSVEREDLTALGLSRSPSNVRSNGAARTVGAANGAEERAEKAEVVTERASQETRPSVVRGLIRAFAPGEVEDKALRKNDESRSNGLRRRRSRLSAWRSKYRSAMTTDAGSPAPRSTGEGRTEDLGSRSARVNIRLLDRESLEGSISFTPGQTPEQGEQPSCIQEGFGTTTAQNIRFRETDPSRRQDTPTKSTSMNKENETSHKTTTRTATVSPGKHPLQLALCPASRAGPMKPGGNAVKAIAAIFESASKNPAFVPSPAQKVSSLPEFKRSSVLSQYTVNLTPTKPPGKSTKATQADAGTSSRQNRLLAVSSRLSRESGEGGLEGAAANRSPALEAEKRVKIVRAEEQSLRFNITVSSRSEEAPYAEQDAGRKVDTESPVPADDGNLTPTTPRTIRNNRISDSPRSPKSPAFPSRSSSSEPCQRQDADTAARLRKQLRRTEQACAMWRERAERAEQRLRELGDGGGDGCSSSGRRQCQSRAGEPPGLETEGWRERCIFGATHSAYPCGHSMVWMETVESKIGEAEYGA